MSFSQKWLTGLLLCLVLIFLCSQSRAESAKTGGIQPIRLENGPHLFVDDLLVGGSSNVVRTPVALFREALSEMPLLTAAQHHTFQPFFTVLHDVTSDKFKLWYGIPTADLNPNRSRIAYVESKDGIHWTNEPRILEVGPIQFGTSVIDEGAGFANQDERYKLGWYLDNGLKVAKSRDGILWHPLTPGVVIPHNHDINGIFYDSLRQRYTAMLSFFITGQGWQDKRRITQESVSTNLIDWSEPWPVVTPDAKDEGETQFYAMDGFLTRGNLTIGMVKVLRDELKADNPSEPPEAYGLGYTALAWTRNGHDWTRERSRFLDRNPRKGAWDHAHAWIDEQVLVGDDIYLYYAGYKSGHKVNRFQERQIGLIKMKRDRYVAHKAKERGTLRTPPLVFGAGKLFINADASHGELQVRVLAPDGKSIKGFGWGDCALVQTDSVKAPVAWKHPLQELANTPVVIEFTLQNATLYGFELE